MLLAVKIIGILLLFIGIIAIFFPSSMKHKLNFFFDDRWISYVSVFRILLGFFLVTASPMSSYPTLLLIAGIVVIFTGFSIPLLSTKKIRRMEMWWLERDELQVRTLAALPISIGGLLVIISS